MAAPCGGLAHRVHPAHADLSRIGPEQADHLGDQRGLPRAVVPQQADDLSGSDAEADVVIGQDAAEAAAEPGDAKYVGVHAAPSDTGGMWIPTVFGY